uniref:Heterochromatin protein 1-binding protein 3 n=1 Tax=Lepisosteus oculatus TaxID=7918 RepID=W5M7D4_LEPOC
SAMPIRRAAGTPPQETAPKNPTAAVDEIRPIRQPDASSEESASAGEEQESEAPAPAPAPAAEDGQAKGDGKEPESKEEKKEEKKPAEEQKKEDKDAVKEKERKVRKTIPAWATMSAKQLARSQKRSQVTLYVRPKIDDILTEAIQACFHKTGASAFAIRKYILKKYPSLELDRRGYLLKQALKRVLQRGAIKQVKGKGFSGSFTVVSSNSKQAQKSKKKSSSGPSRAVTMPEPTEKLEDTLPLIFTRLCEPKEASYRLIKKYVEQYFPKLKVDSSSRPHILKNALQRAVEKGQLEQLTGKGASGTFQIKKAGEKFLLNRSPLEEAILSAITAMNEPKTCSTTALKRFILDNNQGGKVYLQLNNLKRTLRRCEMFGWMEQISGKGFSGTYQLCFPYYPSPATLFPDKHKEGEEDEEESSEEEESEEEESEEESESEEEEPPPKKRPPQKRPPPKQKASTQVFSPKGKRPAPAKKPAPVKKPAPPKKAPAPAKASPTKRAAPSKKPKTPATKKMTSRASKKPPAKKTPAKSPVKAKPAARKSQRTRK